MTAPTWRWNADGKLEVGEGAGVTVHALKPTNAREAQELADLLDEADAVRQVLTRALQSYRDGRAADYEGAYEKIAGIRRELGRALTIGEQAARGAIAKTEPDGLASMFAPGEIVPMMRLGLEVASRLAKGAGAAKPDGR